ncbi:Transglutaminase-like enzyme, putative cysteine protease [Loktanella atrilutea]|uniref:Transglutaminase-like enzyme, putative cysteine protease n=1 Tax=Loktanella atrilutea TaxID=366533 RepID=A0A1M4X496_LOKAT|nr:transglutaminase family protein [Loktanella atrilutea]SHE88012.1 Transglutaminase-like enzyme, putative cysteine protease [Loktanella atrilutea]
MIYDIRLTLATDYAGTASNGRHVVCVMPRDLGPEQRLVAGLLTLSPRPSERRDRIDFFGNAVVEFALDALHGGVEVSVQARVERQVTRQSPQSATSLGALPRIIDACRDMGPDSPVHFIAASARAPLTPAMTAFARAHVVSDMDTAEAVVAVGRALYRTMQFDPKATTVDTPAPEAFAKRHGVCQDFSHIMIACLRGIGIPAGYVSGYLRTRPPPGKPRLEGADAMHAWVRAWCGPQAGWLAFDPTNDRIADSSHIIVAHGRDYGDVAPIRGILRGSGGQTSRQSVDVIPLVDPIPPTATGGE